MFIYNFIYFLFDVHLAYDQALDDLEYLLQYKLVSWLHMGDSRVKRVKGRR